MKASRPDPSKFIPKESEDVFVVSIDVAIHRPDLMVYGRDPSTGAPRGRSQVRIEHDGHYFCASGFHDSTLDAIAGELERLAGKKFGSEA